MLCFSGKSVSNARTRAAAFLKWTLISLLDRLIAVELVNNLRINWNVFRRVAITGDKC